MSDAYERLGSKLGDHPTPRQPGARVSLTARSTSSSTASNRGCANSCLPDPFQVDLFRISPRRYIGQLATKRELAMSHQGIRGLGIGER